MKMDNGDLIGRRYGKLLVLGYDHSEKKRRYWLCQCDCGNTTVVPTASLNSGNTTSCGCGKVPSVIDLTGKRFGRLTALRKLDHKPGEDIKWECVCDCGNRKNVSGRSLKRGKALSCGCLQKESASLLALSKSDPLGPRKESRLYVVWKGIRARCNNPNHKSYSTYGGAGIKMCHEWDDFAVFRDWAYNNGYDENAEKFSCTLDRIDSRKGYSPDNCRWVDMKAQSRNTSRNIIVEYQGDSYIAKDLATKFGLDPRVFITRLNLGLSVGDALSLPKGSILKQGWYSPVICVETGQYFSSVKDAAKFVSRDRSGICVSIRDPKRTCGGFHWRYADDDS